ncbi:MAG: ATP-binding protein [Methanobrevibacter sp.]|nr:ATP-binding protein [Methanobrevibacter sp.]
MGIPVLILGESGSGKSASMRNFKPEEVGIFNVASKPLPFRGKLPTVQNAGYDSILACLKKPSRKCYVIDDSQYLLCFEMFSKSKELGYQKFTDIALHFYNLVQFVIRNTPPDTIVYFLHHAETTTDGKIKAKTIGKMLDEKLTVEGLFSIVLMCCTDGKKHYFVTQSDGNTTAKSPMEMFDIIIDNDLKMVDSAIRSYYDMPDMQQAAGSSN